MIRLDRIYTRSGDSGQTSLGDGTRVAKTSLRIGASGAVDELNSHIGVARSIDPDTAIGEILELLQQRLFDLGADLCCPVAASEQPGDRVRISTARILWLEKHIDESTAQLPALDSFVLPGGTPQAAALHVARTLCRRAERDVLCLQEEEAGSVNPQVAVFLNRLSDLLFVLARRANHDGRADVLWIPETP